MSQLDSPPPPRSRDGILMRAAEQGFLADSLIRFGIRRLLRSRLQEISVNQSKDAVAEFLGDVVDDPVAVATQAANHQHYEVPAEFYRQVLGPHLKYSCCFWEQNSTTLDQAERSALRMTCENAALEDCMSILELGCGWGSLSLWMAKHYPNSHITAVSNSASQGDYIRRQAEIRGIVNLTVQTADMNSYQPNETFDRVVSVEMFEHMRNHRELMNRISQWLRPGGHLFVHLFCHRDTPYLYETDGASNWMGRHFFSGGMMPSADLLPRVAGRLQLVQHTKWTGDHYAKTCRAWLENLDAHRESLAATLAATYGDNEVKVWHNRWRLFFMACEELFAWDQGTEWFVSHYRFQR